MDIADETCRPAREAAGLEHVSVPKPSPTDPRFVMNVNFRSRPQAAILVGRSQGDRQQIALLPNVMLLFVLFPYLTPIPTPFDIQPYAVVCAALLVAREIINGRIGSTPGRLAISGIVALYAVGSALAYGITLDSARSVIGYLSVALIAYATYFSARDINLNLVPIASGVWVFAGLAQRFVDPALFTQFSSRSSTSASRGVTSLAAEPSFYGVVAICILLLADYGYLKGRISKRARIFTILSACISILLAASALVMIIAGLYVVITALSTSDILKLFTRIAVLAGATWALLYLIESSGLFQSMRFYALLNLGGETLREKIFADESVSQRVFAMQATAESLWYSRGLGYGVGTWSTGLPDLLSQSESLRLYPSNAIVGGRIMSGMGTGFYELGLVGMLLPISTLLAGIAAARTTGSPTRHWAAMAAILMCVIMDSAIPLSFPMYPFLFGLICAEVGRDRAAT